MTPPPNESKLRRGAKGTKVSHALRQCPAQGPRGREGVAGRGLTRREVSSRMVLAPQFWIRVRGMTSRAWATALYGHCSTPVMALDFSVRAWATAISQAPPPGTSWGSSSTLRHTCMASWRLRSTSLGKQTGQTEADDSGTSQRPRRPSRLPSSVDQQGGQLRKVPGIVTGQGRPTCQPQRGKLGCLSVKLAYVPVVNYSTH